MVAFANMCSYAMFNTMTVQPGDPARNGGMFFAPRAPQCRVTHGAVKAPSNLVKVVKVGSTGSTSLNQSKNFSSSIDPVQGAFASGAAFFRGARIKLNQGESNQIKPFKKISQNLDVA